MSDDNVISLHTSNDAIGADIVVEEAIGVYENVVIIGWNKQQELEVRASLNLSQSEILWLIETFKARLLSGEYD
jgi:hypothetical protein